MSAYSQGITKYEDVARTIASVAMSLGSYSLIDRLANALSPDAVYRAIYETSRNLDAMAKAGGETYIRQVEEDTKEGKRYTIKIAVKGGRTYQLFGSLATASRVRDFLEESSRDIRIARSVASYAMYLAAREVVRSEAKEVSKQ